MSGQNGESFFFNCSVDGRLGIRAVATKVFHLQTKTSVTLQPEVQTI
jgi:hypothetical protein